MVEWFQERYISRVEHQEIVHYYRKLVARLHGQVREMRTLADARIIEDAAEPGKPAVTLAVPPANAVAAGGSSGKVISFAFHRRRHKSASPAPER